MQTQTITQTKALKEIGITRHQFLKLEKSYQDKFGAPLPLPENAQGHRVFSQSWITWLKGVVQMRDSGAGWLETVLEMQMQQPAREKVKLAPVSAGFEYER